MYQTVYRPGSLSELLKLLQAHKTESLCFLSGATDLAVDINEGRLPKYDGLVCLERISEMKVLGVEEGRLVIGSRVTHETMADSPIIKKYASILGQAAATVGSPAIRTMGTIGGNLSRSSPAADVATALLTMNADIHTVSQEGLRVIKHREFHIAPKRTLLQNNEAIVSISMPAFTGKGAGSSYEKLGQRKALSIAIVSCGVYLELQKDGRTIKYACISLGSAAPTPILAEEASAMLINCEGSDDLFDTVGFAARDSCQPISDIRASSGYRKEMIRVLTRRNLKVAYQRAIADFSRAEGSV